MRTPLRALAAAALIVVPVALAFFSGGFFDRPRLVACVAVWLLVALAALTSPQPLPRSGAGRLALSALAALAAWTALSYAWAPLGARAQADAERLVLYVGAFAAACALLRGDAARRWLEPALAFGAAAVTTYGMGDRLLPGLLHYDRSRTAEGRLEQPLTYWNALGGLSAIGLVLCVRLAGDPARPRGLRAAAAFAGAPLATGLYLTFSRGALLALAAGLAVLIALEPRRAQLRALAAIAVAGGACVTIAASLGSIESLPRGAEGDAGQGAVMIVALIVLGAAAAFVCARAAQLEAPPRLRVRPAVAIAAAVIAIAAAGAALAALESGPASRSAGSPTSAKRFGSADSTRYAYWRVALEQFGDHPLAGDGSGSFAVAWRREPGRPERVVDAHSLYVEFLAELGLIGAAVLAAFLASVGVAAARMRGRRPGWAAGTIAALVAFAAHAGLDWDWEMPAVTGFALLLAGAVVAWSEDALGV